MNPRTKLTYLLVPLLLLLTIPGIVFVQQQRQLTSSRAAYAALDCSKLPTETPNPPQADLLQTTLPEINNIQTSLEQDQQDFYTNPTDESTGFRIKQRLSKRKQELRKIMRGDPTKALNIVTESLKKEIILNASPKCVEKPAVVEGYMSEYIVDYSNGTNTKEYLLKTADETVQVHIAGEYKNEIKSGMKLRVNGYQMDTSLLVDGGQQNNITILESAPTSRAITTKNMVIVLGDFSDTNNTFPTAQTVQTSTLPQIVNYYEQASSSLFTFQGSVVGWNELQIPRTCDIETSITAALQSASSQINWSTIDYFILGAPFQNCGWDGIAGVGPQRISTPAGIREIGVGMVRINNNTLPPGVTIHELGHELGLEHAGFANCGNVMLADTCNIIVYGDLYDVMGNATPMSMLSGYHLEAVGWLNNSTLQTVTSSGTYSVVPLTSSQTGIKVLKIPQPNLQNTVYIEYRQPIGLDASLQSIVNSNVFDGVLIHKRYISTQDVPDQLLLDVSPPTDAKTAALLPNATVTIPGTNITIKNIGKVGQSMQIQVTLAGTSTVPSPTSITPNPSQPGTRLQLNVFYHGLGKGGDNVTPQSSGNMNPLHQQKSITVELYNATNQLVASKSGALSFSSSVGNFQGVLDIGAVAAGPYTVKVRTPHYLKKNAPGILTVPSTPSTLTLQNIFLVTGDANNDNLLSVFDFNHLIDCFSDLSTARNCSDATKKQAADFTDDGLVNQFDYNLFLRELSVQFGE